MKQTAKIFLGILFIAAGVLWILGTFNLFHFNLFFDGWWTIFIYVPCIIGLLTDKDKIGPLVGISVATILLLSAQGLIDWSLVWSLCGGVCIIALGLALIFKPGFDKHARVDLGAVSQNGKNIRTVDMSLGKQLVNFDGEIFEGANIQASFGGLTVDLRNAIINEDVIIKLNCSFCGVEILVPDDLVIKVAANSAFGGVKDTHHSNALDGAPTIYLVGNVSFAGVEIK